MATLDDEFLEQVRAVIARHLDGVESFEVAARNLATVIRSFPPAEIDPALLPHVPGSAKQISLKHLSLPEWMDPRAPYIPTFTIRPLFFAPGRPPEQEQRAIGLLEEAMRLASSGGTDAA